MQSPEINKEKVLEKSAKEVLQEYISNVRAALKEVPLKWGIAAENEGVIDALSFGVFAQTCGFLRKPQWLVAVEHEGRVRAIQHSWGDGVGEAADKAYEFAAALRDAGAEVYGVYRLVYASFVYEDGESAPVARDLEPTTLEDAAEQGALNGLVLEDLLLNRTYTASLAMRDVPNAAGFSLVDFVGQCASWPGVVPADQTVFETVFKKVYADRACIAKTDLTDRIREMLNEALPEYVRHPNPDKNRVFRGYVEVALDALHLDMEELND